MSDAPPPPGWNPSEQQPTPPPPPVGWSDPAPAPPPQQWGAPTAYPPAPMAVDPRKSKLAAGLIAILIPGWGIHNFYLGYTGKAVAQLVLSITCIGALISIPWSIVEGIMILVGSIDRDANGVPLKD